MRLYRTNLHCHIYSDSKFYHKTQLILLSHPIIEFEYPPFICSCFQLFVCVSLKYVCTILPMKLKTIDGFWDSRYLNDWLTLLHMMRKFADSTCPLKCPCLRPYVRNLHSYDPVPMEIEKRATNAEVLLHLM